MWYYHLCKCMHNVIYLFFITSVLQSWWKSETVRQKELYVATGGAHDFAQYFRAKVVILLVLLCPLLVRTVQYSRPFSNPCTQEWTRVARCLFIPTFCCSRISFNILNIKTRVNHRCWIRVFCPKWNLVKVTHTFKCSYLYRPFCVLTPPLMWYSCAVKQCSACHCLAALLFSPFKILLMLVKLNCLILPHWKGPLFFCSSLLAFTDCSAIHFSPPLSGEQILMNIHL